MFYPEVNTEIKVKNAVVKVLENLGYAQGLDSKNEKHYVWKTTNKETLECYITLPQLGGINLTCKFEDYKIGRDFKKYRITASFCNSYFEGSQIDDEVVSTELMTELLADLKKALSKTTAKEWYKY